MHNRFIFILTFFFYSNYSQAEKLTFDVGRNFYISCSNNQVETNNFGKVELKCREGNKTVFTFDSLCLGRTEPISYRYKVYFNNEYWSVFIDQRIKNETCVIGKTTKLGFQTFHLFSLNPGGSTNWVEMHQLDKNVQIVSETNGVVAKDEFYDAHIYQDIERNFNNLFFCRSNDFSAIYVFDCKKANSFSLPVIDGMYAVNNNPFSYFAYSSNRYYLLLENYKTLYSASASSNVSYSVWNDFILAEVGKMATFYQKKENNWNDWSDSICKDPNFLIFYSKDNIECVSKTNQLISLKKSEFSDVFIASEELIVIDSLKKTVQIYSAESNEKFAYQLSKKYVFDREGKQLFIKKRKRRVKRLHFENGKFEIENLSK